MRFNSNSSVACLTYLHFCSVICVVDGLPVGEIGSGEGDGETKGVFVAGATDGPPVRLGVGAAVGLADGLADELTVEVADGSADGLVVAVGEGRCHAGHAEDPM